MASSLPLDQHLTACTRSAAAINAICNDPAVLPGLSLGSAEIDVTALIADDRNIAMLGEHGGALFHRVAPAVYAAHDFFLPSGRGSWALAASREMLAAMFNHYGARIIFAETPVANRACRMFNRWLGFRSEGVALASLYPGSKPQEIETFVMEAWPCR